MNVWAAAEELGIKTSTLITKVQKIKGMNALVKAHPEGPTELDQLSRNFPVKPDERTREVAEAMEKITLDTLVESLKGAGIDPQSLGKMRGIGGIEATAADVLMLGFDMSNRNVIFLQATLMEQANKIREDYLKDTDLDPNEKKFWQRQYHETIDRALKCGASMVQSAVAVARATGGNDRPSRGGKKAEFGFLPLKDKQKHDDAAS